MSPFGLGYDSSARIVRLSGVGVGVGVGRRGPAVETCLRLVGATPPGTVGPTPPAGDPMLERARVKPVGTGTP